MRYTRRRITPLTRGQIRAVVEAAVRAPSVHNTQPWQLHSDGQQLTLSADRSRQLGSTDPSGRELLLSCGAALFNVRVALRHLSRQPRVVLLPDPLEPDLLARIRFGSQVAPTVQEGQWHAAVNLRHTHRGPFLPVPVEQEVLDAAQNAARAEGGELFLVESGQASRTLETLVAAGERAQQAHPYVRQEMTDWTPEPGSARRDGVPAWSYPGNARPAAGEPLGARGFDMARGYGQLPQPNASDCSPLFVLLTAGDRPVDRIQAGQALQAALLTTASRWVFARLYSQATELDGLRAALRHELPERGYPHMMLRFGRADATRPTPRRPVDEVLSTLDRRLP